MQYAGAVSVVSSAMGLKKPDDSQYEYQQRSIACGLKLFSSSMNRSRSRGKSAIITEGAGAAALQRGRAYFEVGRVIPVPVKESRGEERHKKITEVTIFGFE